MRSPTAAWAAITSPQTSCMPRDGSESDAPWHSHRRTSGKGSCMPQIDLLMAFCTAMVHDGHVWPKQSRSGAGRIHKSKEGKDTLPHSASLARGHETETRPHEANSSYSREANTMRNCYVRSGDQNLAAVHVFQGRWRSPDQIKSGCNAPGCARCAAASH